MEVIAAHQFPDIIPGSSIHWVYEDSAPRDYATITALGGSVRDATQRAIAADRYSRIRRTVGHIQCVGAKP